MGYVYRHDSWHQNACNCINATNKKFTSTRVKGEFEYRSSEIRDEVRDQLLGVIHRLQKNNPADSMSLSDLQRMVINAKGIRIYSFVQYVAEDKVDTIITFIEMIEELRGALRDYLSEAYRREDEIVRMITSSKITLHLRRLPYYKIVSQVQDIVKDESDARILVDAHDLAIKRGISILGFVTGDKRDIKNNEEDIIKLLNIHEIKYLKDFKSP